MSDQRPDVAHAASPGDVEKIQRAIELSHGLQAEMGRSLPFIMMGMDRLLDETRNPDAPEIRVEAEQTLGGILIVYLFALWDEHVEHQDVEKYFRPEEKELFFAYKHIRIVAAHNVRGSRVGNRPGRPRMDHADKLDNAVAAGRLPGVEANEQTVMLSLPDAVLGCRQFLQDMSMKLPDRIGAGGPDGKVRVAGGGEHDVM